MKAEVTAFECIKELYGKYEDFGET
jgi:hypothetical protein